MKLKPGRYRYVFSILCFIYPAFVSDNDNTFLVLAEVMQSVLKIRQNVAIVPVHRFSVSLQ